MAEGRHFSYFGCKEILSSQWMTILSQHKRFPECLPPSPIWQRAGSFHLNTDVFRRSSWSYIAPPRRMLSHLVWLLKACPLAQFGRGQAVFINLVFLWKDETFICHCMVLCVRSPRKLPALCQIGLGGRTNIEC